MKKSKPITLPTGDKCPHHIPHNLGVLQWFHWVKKKIEKGEEQKQCPDCGYWLFPEEIGQTSKK